MAKTVGLTFKPAAKAEEKYTCPHCDKEYKSQENLTKHIEDKHPEAAGKSE